MARVRASWRYRSDGDLELGTVILALAGGIALGWLQCRLLARALTGTGKMRFALLPLKAALWLAAMLPLAMYKPMLALVFALGGSATMIAYGVWAKYAARKEE